jgi:PAS domain S-box-containing protein
MTQDADSASWEDAFGGRFRALMANVADMVTISDRDGKILYASPATERVSGSDPCGNGRRWWAGTEPHLTPR